MDDYGLNLTGTLPDYPRLWTTLVTSRGYWSIMALLRKLWPVGTWLFGTVNWFMPGTSIYAVLRCFTVNPPLSRRVHVPFNELQLRN